MPSGVYRKRLAQGKYPIGGNPRRFDNTDTVTSEEIRPTRYENKTVMQEAGLAPKKIMPHDIAVTNTPPPHSHAHGTGLEGKKRGRQAEKSSRTK